MMMLSAGPKRASSFDAAKSAESNMAAQRAALMRRSSAILAKIGSPSRERVPEGTKVIEPLRH